MFQTLKDSFGFSGDIVHAMLWFMPRTMVCLSMLPLFARSYSTWLIRSCFAAAIVLLPAIHYAPEVDLDGHEIQEALFMVVSEALLGMILGLALCLPYYAFKICGNLIDSYRGANFAATVSPTEGGDQLPLEELFTILFVAVFLTGPGLILVINTLYSSFIVIPPGIFSADSLVQWAQALIPLIGRMILVAFLLSAPVLIASLVVEMAMCIISAFAPNLQIYSIQFAVKSMVALGMLLLILEFAQEEVYRSIQTNIEAINLFLLGGGL